MMRHSGYCGILLVDNEKETCEVLGEDYAPDFRRELPDDFLENDFYRIARTWKDTISGSNCLIAKNETDLQVIAERILVRI